MSLQCGIVGLPNVGKSTLFNCLSNAKAQSANFPFCTIEPNVGVITVPDERLNKLAELVHPQSCMYCVASTMTTLLTWTEQSTRYATRKSSISSSN